METKKIILIFIFFILLISQGRTILVNNPSSFSLMGFTWDLSPAEENEESYNINGQSGIVASELLSIDNLKSSQHIYGLNDSAKVYFNVQNKLNRPYPYNVAVYWIHDNKMYLGWENKTNMSANFSSYYPVNSQGAWETQVVLKWEHLNESYSKDEIITFKVI